MTDPQPPTYTWVADRGTAWSAAYALTVLELHQLRFRLFATTVVIGLPTLLVAVGTGGDVFLLLLGLVLAGFLLVSTTVIAAWGRWSMFRRSLPAGLELSTRFGPDHLLLRSRWTETTVWFRAYDRMDVVNGWVFLRHRDRRVRVVYPQELLPPDDFARLRLTIHGLVPDDDQ
jgi:hypothetical protein